MTRNTDSPLAKTIQKTITQKGAIPFSEFMSLALYHPVHGYYTCAETQQDFYTNADVHPVFGETLAAYFCSEWQKIKQPPKQFQLIELGCGEGKLASHVLNWMESHQSDLYARTQYLGIEPGAARRSHAEKLNARFKHHAVFSPDFNFPTSSVEGIVFSNEFFDALPFDRVTVRDRKILELRVGENFSEISVPADRRLTQYFSWLKAKPAEGCIAEAHLSSRNWMRRIARSLIRGLVVTFDYGHPARELYSEIRPEGTALCHFEHRTSRDFFANIGQQDITAHVNFTVLEKEAAQSGLRSEPLTTQSRFLLEHGLEDMVLKVGKSADAVSRLKLTSAIKSLIHPEGMGGTFKVLVQRKNIL